MFKYLAECIFERDKNLMLMCWKVTIDNKRL